MSKPEKYKKIDENLCFRGEGFSVECMQNALDSYQKNKKSIDEWLYHNDTPIFLDTNVLLNIYMAVIPDRENVLKILEDNKSRIYITGRVQQEFDKHRLVFIDKYRQKLTNLAINFRLQHKQFKFQPSKIAADLRNALIDDNLMDLLPESVELAEDIKNWFAQNSPFVAEYATIETKLAKLLSTFNEEYGKLYDKACIEFHDPLLDILSQTNLLQNRTAAEVEFTKQIFTTMMECYNLKKSERADYMRFPGSGENKEPEKKEEPWGDLLIYHEILSFMATKGKDALFITNDFSKQDWMKKSGEPYSYYIADTYRNTGHNLYIIKVADFFPSDYDPTESLVADEDSIGVIPQLATPQSANNEVSKENYSDVTEDEFLAELNAILEKKRTASFPHVTKNNFIFNKLGKKGYKYSTSFKMLEHLIDSKIELYDVKVADRTVKCIKTK